MEFSLSYEVERHGWATLTVSDGNRVIERPVSYLHDSLRDLAEMALAIRGGAPEAQAVFLDEPGEYRLVAHLMEDGAHYELQQNPEWLSWGMGNESDSEVLLEGVCPPGQIIRQISTILWHLHQSLGIEEYQRRWIEHEFPVRQFRELVCVPSC